MIYYKLVKVTINAPGLVKVIIDVVVHYYKLTLIIHIKVLVFAVLLFRDQKKLFTTFYL